MTIDYDIKNNPTVNQEQVNLMTGALVSLMKKNNITYTGEPSCIDGVCTVDNPSADITFTIDDILAEQQSIATMVGPIALNEGNDPDLL